MIEKEIYKMALDKWGLDLQLVMMIEECAELIHAICKYKRSWNIEDVDNLLEELADVDIMINQMKEYFDWNIVKKQKLERLEKLLESK